MTKTDAPSRATATLNIGFGLLNITCAVYAGIEDHQVHRKMRTLAGEEVGYVLYNKVDGEPVARDDIQMVYVTDDGVEVPLTDNEIAAALNEENGKAEVVGFYPLAQASRYVVANFMQVRPKKVGKKSPSDKAFALLMEAMDETGKFMLLKYTLRGKPSLGVLTSDGILRQVKWDDEVRDSRPLPEVEVTAPEKAMAMQLINVLAGDDAPLLDDEASEKIRTYADTKAANEGKAPAEGVAGPDPKAAFADLTAALEASLAAAKVSA